MDGSYHTNRPLPPPPSNFSSQPQNARAEEDLNNENVNMNSFTPGTNPEDQNRASLMEDRTNGNMFSSDEAGDSSEDSDEDLITSYLTGRTDEISNVFNAADGGNNMVNHSNNIRAGNNANFMAKNGQDLRNGSGDHHSSNNNHNSQVVRPLGGLFENSDCASEAIGHSLDSFAVEVFDLKGFPVSLGELDTISADSLGQIPYKFC